MEFKQLTYDVKIPVLGLGLWRVGGKMHKDTSHDKEELAAIQAALEMGYTHFDTAEMYSAGHSEELLGHAIVAVDREDLFITTKVSPEHLRYTDVIASCKASLKRLETDYIDLYLIHAPNSAIPIAETMKALDFLVEEHLVRSIGVSNFGVEDLKDAQAATKNKISANQIEYNLLKRNNGMYTPDVESIIIPYCQKNNIMVIAWRPVEYGKLAKPEFSVLDDIAKKYGKTQVQIALNWLIAKKGIITIPKSTTISHLKENIGAVGWRLSQEDMRRLDRGFT